MKRILVAYDGGEPAKRALDTAAMLAKKFDASLSVISVVPTVTSWAAVNPWDDHEVHRQELAEARTLLALQGIEPELIEPVGEPAGTIERTAREGGYDTVVIGSRGLGAISRMFQGSVSEHVATHAKATVVVVR